MLTRPPPLQLQLDNFPVQQPAPSPRPKIRSFISQIYQANWRNIVIAVAAINALRYLLSASNAFQDVRIDKLHHAPKLARISIALGAMYIVIAVIQVFGVLGVSMRRLKLIRLYAHLAFISALLITVAGFVAGVSYFLLAEDLVHECITLSVGGSLHTKTIFRGKAWKSALPTTKAAQDHCLSAWSRGSVSQVFSVFAFSLVPAIVYFLLAYIYYRQTTDPNHPARLCVNGAASAIRMDAYPAARYSPLYNGGSPPQQSEDITNALQRPRPPQQHRKVTAAKAPKPARSQPPVMLQFSPVMRSAYMMTPGPPSFGPSRDYRAGFFSVGSDDGKFV